VPSLLGAQPSASPQNERFLTQAQAPLAPHTNDGCGDSAAAWAESLGAYPLILLLVASITVLVQGSIACTGYCDGKTAYAITAGAISLVVALLVFARFARHTRLVAYLLVAWWTAGVCTFTFFGPFKSVGNGYLASWTGLFASILILRQTAPSDVEKAEAFLKGIADSPRDVLLRHILLFGSVVVLWASSVTCSQMESCEGEVAWAVACSTVSVVVMIPYHTPLRAKLNDCINKGVMGFLSAWWIAGVVTMTGKGPFTSAGNGFFGAWVCLAMVLCLTMDAFQQQLGGFPDLGVSNHSSQCNAQASAVETACEHYAPPPIPHATNDIYDSPAEVEERKRTWGDP